MPAEARVGDDALIGVLVDGRYRIDALVGRGGMGRVYRATHVALGRPIALKVLDPRHGIVDDDRARFEREAQATGRLRHPNCVSVSDFGALPDGSLYLAMELLDGKTLDDLLEETTRLPVARAVHVMRHVLRGLEHAHAHGLVHRDLKPCNIMLVASGDDPDFAKVLDFGLARMIGDGDDRITRTGVICGTPAYMSPEQCQDRRLDARSDLYAASVIFFETLAGVPPFHADEAVRTLAMHVGGEVPWIADVAPGVVVPAALEAVIRRGLAKRPQDRPASAAEYLAELDRAIASPAATIEVVVATQVTSASAMPALGRRVRPWHAGAALAALVVVGLVAARIQAGGDAAAAPSAPVATRAAEPEPEILPLPSRDPAIDEALAMARDGRRHAAVEQLRALRKQHPRDAQIPLALGHVYTGLGWPRQAADAYRAAIRLDPATRADAWLIRNLCGLLESKSTWSYASQVIERDVGAAAVDALTEVASEHESPTVRERAARILRRLQAG